MEANKKREIVISPFPQSIRRALGQLGFDELVDTTTSNMGLKTLLYLISISDIPSDHQQITEGMRRAMQRHAQGDYTVFEPYERAIISLTAQKHRAEQLAEQKVRDEAAAIAERESHRANLEKIAQQVAENEKIRGLLDERARGLEECERVLSARARVIQQQEDALNERKKKARARARKKRRK